MFHFTQTAHSVQFSHRIVLGVPASRKGDVRRASLGVVFRAGGRLGPLTQPSSSELPGVVAVLALSLAESDHTLLGSTFRDTGLTLYPNCRLTLQPSPTLDSALNALRASRIPIVLCDNDAEPGAWREILRAGKALAAPPCVIVCSRGADDRLWMELLHEGVFDVVAKPLDPAEVTRIVHTAWVHWRNRYELTGE